MSVSNKKALANLPKAVNKIFRSDVRVQAVGIGRNGSAFGFRAVRNVRKVVPSSASTQSLGAIDRIPIRYIDAENDVESAVRVPAAGPGSPAAVSFVAEQSRHRPLVCGLQIQNYDDDDRQGNLADGFITIGTLGCFVRLVSGTDALLSNNHVVAGENDGQNGTDRILQPGTATAGQINQQRIATLTDFVTLTESPAGARPHLGNVVFNVLDAGVATLAARVRFNQDYLAQHNVTAPNGIATARVGDQVFKVGRTTSLTFGEVTMASTVVGPVPYRHGDCWFERSIEIEGNNGTQFSDKGDSGAAIVRTNGEVIGILYAGNGTQTYACPIDDVLTELNCSLI